MKKDIIVTSMLATLFLLSVTILPCRADNSTLYGCAQKKKGSLRLVSDPSKCNKSEYPVALSSAVSPYDELKALAIGTVTSYGPPGCQSSSGGCTITDQGTVEGNVIHDGTFTHSAVVLWTQGNPNGSGGICAPASGTLNIATPNGSTLTIQRTGTLCEVGASGSGNYTFNSTYFIAAGTKDFEGASGTGILICSVDGAGTVQGFAHGTIKY